MELLPSPLVQRVLAFAVPGYAKDLPPDRRNGVVLVLKELKFVSKAWLAPIREAVHLYRGSTLILKFVTASEHELRQMYQNVVAKGSQISELHVSMGTLESFSHFFNLRTELRGVVENVTIDWPRIFACLPNLKTLNLTAMHLDSCQVISALLAAGMHCPKLEKLALPFEKYGVNEDKVQGVLDTLYSALKRWKTGGNGVGLRHLKVPTRNNKDKFRASKAFFDNVMAYCPNVEYLDGYKDSLSTWETLTCKDAWLLALEDWERLNATCTKLVEFNWVVAPFGDPFFRAFGQHTKPQLKKLSFCVNMHWKWRWYFYDSSRAAGDLPDEDWEEEYYCERPGYGFLATDPGAALKGCPKLDELVVKLYHAVDHRMYIPPDMGDVNDFPEVEVLNQNVFGDEFCETLATHCPFLTRFVMEEVGEYFNRQDLKPTMTFTDQGLMALTRLTFLRSLRLRSINCTGKGVLAFLNAQSNEFRGNRSFEITVGGCPANYRLAFYDVVKELLVQLADMQDPPCASQKFALRIENWTYSSRETVDAVWSEAYLTELKTLMDRVKRSHPSLRQHVVTMGRNGDSFTRIAEFGLYTVRSNADSYCNWEDWEQERENEGITIVDREDLLTDKTGPAVISAASTTRTKIISTVISTIAKVKATSTPSTSRTAVILRCRLSFQYSNMCSHFVLRDQF